MRILVIGGTGFIGYHVVRTLLTQGDDVAVMCRNTATSEELFGKDVAAISGDVATLQTRDYQQLLQGFDAVVFAAGVDERCEPEGDAEEFFYRANVWPCEQLFAAIPQTTVRRAVLLNSIFSWLHQQQPELELTRQHPYIASRVEQNRVAQAAIKDSQCVLVTIQVPWVFGSAPHRESQWVNLVAFVRAAVPLMCIRGGAAMMSVSALAAAVSGALRYPVSSIALPVGDENLTYVELIQRLADIVGRKDRQVSHIADGFFHSLSALGEFVGGLFGKQGGGLNLNHVAELLCRNIFIDQKSSQEILHYQGGDLDQALCDTVDSIPEGFWLSGWRKSLNWFSIG
jgi:nucleoside-diphosphate-sugar epimerase